MANEAMREKNIQEQLIELIMDAQICASTVFLFDSKAKAAMWLPCCDNEVRFITLRGADRIESLYFRD